MNWILTRKDNNDMIEFPQDMRWSDEFDWSAIAQTTPVYSLGGSVLVQQGTKLAGRPISLTGDWVWHQRKDLEKLQSWSNVSELEMTLKHYDGREFNVIFRTHQSVFADVDPIRYQTPESENEKYRFSLNLMTI